MENNVPQTDDLILSESVLQEPVPSTAYAHEPLDPRDFLRAPVWYPHLSEYTSMTSFVRLSPEEIGLLIAGANKGKEIRGVIERLQLCMRGGLFDNFFISTDYCSPTDTERFYVKRGAVHSAESAWRYLVRSEKIRNAAAAGRVEFLCVKPFENIDRTREFRLFIYRRELKVMCQYNLIRHFRRLEGIKKELWKQIRRWFDQVAWRLPMDDLVIDIYFDAEDRVRVVDLNSFGAPTSPLLLNRWDRNWDEVESGILLMPPPTRISGDVAVSF